MAILLSVKQRCEEIQRQFDILQLQLKPESLAYEERFICIAKRIALINPQQNFSDSILINQLKKRILAAIIPNYHKPFRHEAGGVFANLETLPVALLQRTALFLQPSDIAALKRVNNSIHLALNDEQVVHMIKRSMISQDPEVVADFIDDGKNTLCFGYYFDLEEAITNKNSKIRFCDVICLAEPSQKDRRVSMGLFLLTRHEKKVIDGLKKANPKAVICIKCRYTDEHFYLPRIEKLKSRLSQKITNSRSEKQKACFQTVLDFLNSDGSIPVAHSNEQEDHAEKFIDAISGHIGKDVKSELIQMAFEKQKSLLAKEIEIVRDPTNKFAKQPPHILGNMALLKRYPYGLHPYTKAVLMLDFLNDEFNRQTPAALPRSLNTGRLGG